MLVEACACVSKEQMGAFRVLNVSGRGGGKQAGYLLLAVNHKCTFFLCVCLF